jgi:hypothetical protein
MLPPLFHKQSCQAVRFQETRLALNHFKTCSTNRPTNDHGLGLKNSIRRFDNLVDLKEDPTGTIASPSVAPQAALFHSRSAKIFSTFRLPSKVRPAEQAAFFALESLQKRPI